MVMMRGAYTDSSARGLGSTLSISSRMCSRARLAFCSASRISSSDRPSILMSIWMEVTPSRVPATLKSMSPSASSLPRMSVSTATRSPSLISPIATPATAARMGTPASISDSEPAHTVAMDDDPLLSSTSLTMRTV
jgi:hypothetical protein